jgi:hypothetical protein
MFETITWSWSNTTTLAPVDKLLGPDTIGMASLKSFLHRKDSTDTWWWHSTTDTWWCHSITTTLAIMVREHRNIRLENWQWLLCIWSFVQTKTLGCTSNSWIVARRLRWLRYLKSTYLDFHALLVPSDMKWECWAHSTTLPCSKFVRNCTCAWLAPA